MMNQNDNQGKRPDQIKTSEQLFFWSAVGIIILVVVLKLFY